MEVGVFRKNDLTNNLLPRQAGDFFMHMAERLEGQQLKTIVVTEAKPLPEGTLINGEYIAPLTY